MLANRRIAVLGYGSQGRAWALNLKDSGCNILIGLPERSKSRARAKRDGFNVILSIGKAVGGANVIVFAFPDHLQGRVFENDIRPNLNRKSSLIFLHGFSIHFKTIIPPNDCDIILLAPLAPGMAVREKYIKGESVRCFYSIHRNRTGEAKTVFKTLTKGLRINRREMIKTTFADEAIGDIFGEQAVLCGGLSQLIRTGYDTLVQAGLSSDKAYLEVAYQLDLIIDLIKIFGIEGMLKRISVAARYGAALTGPKIIDQEVKMKMKKVLREIKTGQFAARLNSLNSRRMIELNRRLKDLTSPSFEKAARKFSPLKKNKG
ncbi:MAG: ketol-acid reductoisomerase [candidate division Zixibacteria bacterium]|nr:ketol-acid reductoisomerase [candidate division Zixibacteria bacterium]